MFVALVDFDTQLFKVVFARLSFEIQLVIGIEVYFAHFNALTVEPRWALLTCILNFSAKQDGRLAMAYFSPNYKYFDQLLQTVKNKTTVLNLVFKEFFQTSIPPLISVLYGKGFHNFPSKSFCLTVPNHFVEEPFYVSESFGYRKVLCRKVFCLRGECHNFLSKICCLTVPKNFVGEPFRV